MDNKKVNTSLGALINGCLVVSVDDEVNDLKLDQFCHGLLSKLEKAEIKRVILDFNRLTTLDSYTFNKLSNLSKTIKLMGAVVVWSKLSPGVVSTLIDFNVDTNEIYFSSTVEQGMKSIDSNDIY